MSELNISDDEVLNVLDLDITEAMRSDGIPPIVLQRCALALYQPLSYLFNNFHIYLATGKFIRLFKSGDLTSVKNYHPISLYSVIESIIYSKIVGSYFNFHQPRPTWIYA